MLARSKWKKKVLASRNFENDRNRTIRRTISTFNTLRWILYRKKYIESKKWSIIGVLWSIWRMKYRFWKDLRSKSTGFLYENVDFLNFNVMRQCMWFSTSIYHYKSDIDSEVGIFIIYTSLWGLICHGYATFWRFMSDKSTVLSRKNRFL